MGSFGSVGTGNVQGFCGLISRYAQPKPSAPAMITAMPTTLAVGRCHRRPYSVSAKPARRMTHTATRIPQRMIPRVRAAEAAAPRSGVLRSDKRAHVRILRLHASGELGSGILPAFRDSSARSQMWKRRAGRRTAAGAVAVLMSVTALRDRRKGSVVSEVRRTAAVEACHRAVLKLRHYRELGIRDRKKYGPSRSHSYARSTVGRPFGPSCAWAVT